MTLNISKTDYENAIEYLTLSQFQTFKEIRKEIGKDFSFDELCLLLAKKTKIVEVLPEFTNTVNLYFHVLKMHQHGEKIYYITPGLITNLAKTDINIDSCFLKSPFQELFFRIDPGIFKMKSHATKKEMDVTGFFVYLKEFEFHKELRVTATGMADGIDGILDTFYTKIIIKPGKIKDQIKRFYKEHSVNIEEMERFGASLNIDHLQEFLHFIINSLLYITSKDIRHTYFNAYEKIRNYSDNKKQKFFNENPTVTRKHIVIIGAEISETKEYMDIKNSGGVGNWKLSHKIKVSAHWRNQQYGNIDNPQHKLVWINEYEKGPDMSDYINNLHVIK